MLVFTWARGFVQIRQNGQEWCHLAHSTHEHYPLLARCAAGVIYLWTPDPRQGSEADCLNDLIAYLSRMNVARNTAALTALHVDSDATQSSSHDWTEGG